MSNSSIQACARSANAVRARKEPAMKPIGRGSHGRLPAAIAAVATAGVLGVAWSHIGLWAAVSREGRPSGPEASAILARVRQQEDRIRSGRVILARVTEYTPPSEQELRERIKDPDALRSEIQAARHMPSRIVEKETILFDNTRGRLLARATRARGQIAANQALFTKGLFQTQNEFRGVREQERQQVFINKPLWPPYSPYDRWQGRIWTARAAAIQAGQISLRWLGEDPATGQVLLRLIGGLGSQLDQKVWIDRRRGHTISRLQLFDKQTGRLELDERASYRQYRPGIWYPIRLVSNYYTYDRAGERRLVRREVSKVATADLNIALPEAAFTVIVPRGVFVQDNRVAPPLVYHQGLASPAVLQREHERARSQALLVGQPAPEFELPSLSGETTRSAELRGKVVLLNFFAYG
jgi:hypothetical protein